MLEKTRGIILHQIKYTDSGIVAQVIHQKIRKAILSYKRDEKQENQENIISCFSLCSFSILRSVIKNPREMHVTERIFCFILSL